MSLAAQTALSVGVVMPLFRLPEPLTGRLLGPDDYPEARVLLVAFLTNGCPEVERLASALAELAWELDGDGLRILALNSADGDALPGEAPAAVAAEALRRGYVFPYLIDQTQAVARAYGVQHTPDFYVFGPDRRLAYHGRFDDTRFGWGRAPHGRDLRQAIARALDGRAPIDRQVASLGCRIRWREAGAP